MKVVDPVIDLSVENVERHFIALSRFGNLDPDLEDGFSRPSWSDEESQAMEYIRQAGRVGGLQAAYDGVGNLYLSTPVTAQRVIQIGSHLDTVPFGGQFDGGAGIVAGLEAILALKKRWAEVDCILQLVVWRGEESATFGAVCKGSQAAFGLNDPGILDKKFQQKTLEEAILSQGFDPSYIRQRKPALSQQQIDSIAAHFELHIEQANLLQAAARQIGIVTSIRGAYRCRVEITGEAAHSGGTPMGCDFRKDANLAMAYIQVKLDQLVSEWLDRGEDLVQTVGVVNADPDFNLQDRRVYENAVTKVSPFSYFTLDIRSRRGATLSAYTREARRVIARTGADFGVRVEIVEMNELTPTETLDKNLISLLEGTCRKLEVGYLHMPSGALHDAAVVASQRRSDGSSIPVAMVFVPCRDGISHNPQEYTSPQDIQAGARLLAGAIWELASAKWVDDD